MQYLLERRKDLGGFLPARKVAPSPQPLSPEGRGANQAPLAPRGRGVGGEGEGDLIRSPALTAPPREAFGRFLKGSGKTPVSTTGGFVEVLKFLLQDKAL